MSKRGWISGPMTTRVYTERCKVTGKIRFPNRLTAQQELIRAQQNGREEKRSYQCEHCNSWHLTQRKNP